MKQIGARELADWLADTNRPPPVLLDVREPWELEMCQIPGSLHMPMHLVPLRHSELPDNDEIIVICHHGGRSMQVAMYLERQGFKTVTNLQGGVEAWACSVDPGMRRY